jgi:serine/threonine protein kinase
MMTDWVGIQLGNYRLTQLIGQGGFAEVYLGEHIYLGTLAAVKLLKKIDSEQHKEMFKGEARTLAFLKHPHILRLLDFGFHNETTPYLVMEYATNGTLRVRHPHGSRLPVTTTVSYIKQVASALQYAHDAKHIHRDIKPENMLVDEQNNILLSDFGIAAVAHSTSSMVTIDNSGTVHYMAPEQIQGKPRPASDQYALATVAYEWLCGMRPFTGSSFIEIAMHHISDAPSPLREKVPTISPDVEQVILTALAKDPQQRFGSIQAFAHALEQAVQSVPLPDVTLPAHGKLVVPQKAPREDISAPQRFDQPPSLVPQPVPPVEPPVSTEPVTSSAFSALPTEVSSPLESLHPSEMKDALQWFQEGNRYFSRRRYKDAILAYSRAINMDPRHADAYHNRGLSYWYLQQYEQAIHDYSQLIALNYQDADVYNNRGVAYQHLQQYEQAISDFDQAITLNPKYARAYYNRGLTYRELEQYQQAKSDLDQAIALNPKLAHL